MDTVPLSLALKTCAEAEKAHKLKKKKKILSAIACWISAQFYLYSASEYAAISIFPFPKCPSCSSEKLSHTRSRELICKWPQEEAVPPRQGMLISPAMSAQVPNLNYLISWFYFWLILWNVEAPMPSAMSVAALLLIKSTSPERSNYHECLEITWRQGVPLSTV